MRVNVLRSLTVALAVGTLWVAGVAGAAEYPSDTIRVTVPWKAGGGTDTIGRGFAAAMEQFLKVPVVVENISGASSAVGNLKVAQAKPNGYTVLLNGTGELVVNLVFKPELPFSLDSYKYAGGFFSTPTYVLSHKDRGYKDLKDLFDKARRNPDTVTVGTTGAANAHFLMARAMKGISGVPFRIIPYEGGGPLKKALIGNQVDAGIIHSPVSLSEIRAGLLRVLATAGSLEKIEYPPIRGTKTLPAYGIPIEVGTTRGLYVPKDTPDEVVAKLAEVAEKAAKSAQFDKFARRFGFAPVWLSPAEFAALNRRTLETYTQIKAKYLQ